MKYLKIFFLLLITNGNTLYSQMKVGSDVKNIDVKSAFEVEAKNGNSLTILKDTLRIGIGTVTPNSSSILNLESNSMGFLPPRMTQSQRNANITQPATGLVIYCTDCNSGSGCIQVNDGTPAVPNWNCLNAPSTPAVTATCNGFTGNYYANNALSGTTYTVTMTNNSFSSATIAFATTDLVLSGVSGITVASVSPTSQTLTSGQTATITYTLSGTPTTKGTLSGNWTKLSLNCSKSINVVNQPPVFNCNGATISPNSFTLTNGSTYTGTITIPYTVSAGGDSYPAESIVSNGITFSRLAGTYSSPSGTITYNISGTYTGTSNNTFTISTDASAGSCSVVIFDAIRGALAQAGCSSCSAYDAAAVNSMVSITKAEYDKIFLISGASKSGSTDAFVSTNSPNPQLYGGNTTFTSNNTYNTNIPASNYIMAFQVRSSTSAPPTMAGIQLKTSTGHTGTYVNYGGTSPAASTSLASTNYFFVFKRPNITTASGSNSFFAFYMSQSGQIQIYPQGGTSYSAAGNVTSFSSSASQATLAQFISTATKQW